MALAQLRAQIDAVDEQLYEAFMTRMALCEAIAEEKRKSGAPLVHPEREAAILRWAGEKAGDRAYYAQQYFSALIELSKARQREWLQPSPPIVERLQMALSAAHPFPPTGVVACIHGTNRQGCPALCVPTIADVFEAVVSGRCQYGLLERNERATYEALLSDPVYIVARANCQNWMYIERQGNLYRGADVIHLALPINAWNHTLHWLSPDALQWKQTVNGYFFIEWRADVAEPEVRTRLAHLERNVEGLRFLGASVEVHHG